MPQETTDSLRNPTPELEWQSDGMPFSRKFKDIYYSAEDAIKESQHVFIEGNRLAVRWQQSDSGPAEFCIAEIGFGAGLNFLNTWRQWQSSVAQAGRGQRLHYLGIEQYPLTSNELERLYEQWPEFKTEAELLLSLYQSESKGWHRLHVAEDVCLDLFFGDAYTELAARSLRDKKVDAWYVDGFSPKLNPDLWSDSLFTLLAAHSHSATTLATYSAAGHVRRGLEAAGFRVNKEAGFGNKRHMLCATFASATSSSALEKKETESFRQEPWFILPKPTAPKDRADNQAIVIGAGLAGACCARSLALRGWQVTVLERAQRVAAGGSSIPQLALRLRLFQQGSPEALFYLQAYLYALNLYASLSNADQVWNQTGILQLPDALNKANALSADKISKLYAQAVVQLVGSQAFPSVNFSNSEQMAYWFPQGGWSSADKLCLALLSHKRINLQLNAEVCALERDDLNWLVKESTSNQHYSAPVVVIAAGEQLQSFDQTRDLPLQCSPGQSSSIKCSAEGENPEFVVSGARSILPPLYGRRTVSASYRQQSESTEPRLQDDEANLAAYLTTLSGVTAEQTAIAESHVAVRANSPDRVPQVGMVPDIQAMAIRYAKLASNAQQKFTETGIYHQGLFVSAAHGSTGLTSAPLSGEYLASLISGSCLPLSLQHMNMLNPARFVIQDLKKQRW